MDGFNQKKLTVSNICCKITKRTSGIEENYIEVNKILFIECSRGECLYVELP